MVERNDRRPCAVGLEPAVDAPEHGERHERVHETHRRHRHGRHEETEGEEPLVVHAVGKEAVRELAKTVRYEEDRTDDTDLCGIDRTRRQKRLLDDGIALTDDVVEGVADRDGSEDAPAQAVEDALRLLRILHGRRIRRREEKFVEKSKHE